MTSSTYTQAQIDTLLAGKAAVGSGGSAVASVAGRTGAVVLAETDITGLVADLASKASTSALAAKADLVGGVVPTSQIPSISLETAVVVANRTAMLALTTTQVQPGDIAVDTSTGSTRGSYILTATDPSVIGSWLLLNAPLDVVQSVNGQSGTVVLAKADVALGNVDNTSDVNKPVSTAQTAAFASKFSRRLLPRRELVYPRLTATRPALYGPDNTLFSSRVAGTQVEYLGNPTDPTSVITYSGSVGWNNRSDGAAVNGYYGPIQPSGSTGPAGIFEFVTDAPGLGLRIALGGGAVIDIEVDGERLIPLPLAAASAGNTTYYTIVYGTRKLRHYRITATESFALRSVTVSRTDTIYRPFGNGPRIVWQADSYGQTTGSTGLTPATGSSCWTIPMLTARLLGASITVDAEGGTGYAINTAGAPTLNFANRTANVTGSTPDIIVVAGGINDALSGLQAAATAVLQTYRTAFPTTPIFVLGPWAPSSASQTSQAAKYTAIAAAAAAANCTYIDTTGLITGSGNTAAPATDGNADIFISSDGTHTVIDGKKFLAAAIAQKISAAFAA